MSDETHLSLVAALFAVHLEVKTLGKGDWNDHGKYYFAKGDTVVLEARKLLGKHSLIWVRTEASICAPALAAGRIGERAHVGHVHIAGQLMHTSGGILAVSADVPIVAMSATPHDKAWAASVTFGTGYLLLGILNQDRANAEEISARGDEDVPTCTREVADENRKLCSELAGLDNANGETVWNWACSEAGVPEGPERYPGPGELYAAEAADVGKLLRTTLEGRRPHVNKPDAGAIMGLVRELVELRKDPASAVWKDCLSRAGITGEPQPRELSDNDARKAKVILEAMATRARVDAKVDDDQRPQPGDET